MTSARPSLSMRTDSSSIDAAHAFFEMPVPWIHARGFRPSDSA